jgi:hypothetical protein
MSEVPGQAGSQLEAFAQRKFPDLRKAERKLVWTAPTGRWCSFGEAKFVDEKSWGTQRDIRSELLRWLCSDLEARKLVDPVGIRVEGAKISSRLELTYLTLPFPLSFESCWFPAGIDLSSATIPALSLDGSWLGSLDRPMPQKKDEYPIFLAEELHVSGTVSFRFKFHARGEVRLLGADIGGDLTCSESKFHNAGKTALNAERARVRGNVHLRRRFGAAGEVELSGATIGGNLDCEDGVFVNPRKKAFVADGTIIAGSLFLRSRRRRGFRAYGEVSLLHAKIGGDLDCDGGRFNRIGITTLVADGATIGRVLRLGRGFRAKGEVRFHAADIGKDLDLSSADLSTGTGASLDLRSAAIHDSLIMRDIKNAHGTRIDLRSASCRELNDDLQNWPGKGRLNLDGFIYGRLTDYGLIDDSRKWLPKCLRKDIPKTRIKWLRRNLPKARTERRGRFRPQPYQQLAQVLRADGRDGDARKVMISMAVDRRKWGGLGWWAGKRHWVLWALIGNGYAPLRAVWWLLVLWLAGFLAFGAGYQARLMVPTEQRAHSEFVPKGSAPGWYEPFCALTYAVDTSLPIISLGQRERWHPDASKPPIESEGSAVDGLLRNLLCNANFTHDWLSASERCATLLNWFRWIYIPIGWFLTTMFVAGVSGLVGRE